MSERLQLLADASRILAESSLDYAETLEALARIVVPRLADDCVVFLADGERIVRVTEASVSEDNAAVLRKLRENPPAFGASNTVMTAVRAGQTVFVDAVDDRALANLAGSTEHAAALRAVHPRTFITVPLFGRGKVIGAFTFGMSVSSRSYTPDDVELAEELGRRAGMAIENARLLRDAEAGRLRLAFLASASELLASTLDRERVLDDLVRLVVPRFADWCGIEIVEGDTTRQVAVGHVDPAKIAWAKQLREQYPPDRTQPYGVFEVIRTGKPELYATIPSELLERSARNAEHLELLRKLAMRSAVVVPMTAHGKPVGAITAVWAESGHTYSENDVELFMELGHRAALAVENAHLYRDLQQAVQVRDDFLAAAGHELKTPLAALLMHVDSMHRQLQKNVVPTNLFQRLDKASKAGTRLAKLIDELLDVSRIKAGRLSLEPEPFAFDELVREVVERFADQGGAAITLTTQPVRGTWDRSRVDQVVSNLVANALKYGRGQPIDIDVSATDGVAVFRITDRGIGIAASEQQKIFERFERAVENREFGGFGLGLWIARQIVEASGGTITVASEPGKGATFTVKLPR